MYSFNREKYLLDSSLDFRFSIFSLLRLFVKFDCITRVIVSHAPRECILLWNLYFWIFTAVRTGSTFRCGPDFGISSIFHFLPLCVCVSAFPIFLFVNKINWFGRFDWWLFFFASIFILFSLSAHNNVMKSICSSGYHIFPSYFLRSKYPFPFCSWALSRFSKYICIRIYFSSTWMARSISSGKKKKTMVKNLSHINMFVSRINDKHMFVMYAPRFQNLLI